MAAKEAPSLFESVKQWAAIGILGFGTIALASMVLPLGVFNFLANSAIIGGAVGAGIWAVNKVVNFAKGTGKTA